MLQPQEQLNQKLGALRSDITITLHSRMGTQLWNGRQAVFEKGKRVQGGISSMPFILKNLTQIQRDAENDDPFADYYLLNFEAKVIAHRAEMQKLIDEMGERYASSIPEGIDISRCENITPAKYQILSNSQLGFQLIYLLTEFDVFSRTVATAQHIALLTRQEASKLNDKGANLVRQCFGVVETYRHSGVTRLDAAENNARYQEACKRFKLDGLPQDILSGERRANFAPVIRNPSIQEDGADKKQTPSVETESSFIEVNPLSEDKEA